MTIYHSKVENSSQIIVAIIFLCFHVNIKFSSINILKKHHNIVTDPILFENKY
jgi:hypothetical protein